MNYDTGDLVLVFRLLAACVLTLGIVCIVWHQHLTELSASPIQLYGASLVAMGVGIIGIARSIRVAEELQHYEEVQELKDQLENQPKSE